MDPIYINPAATSATGPTHATQRMARGVMLSWLYVLCSAALLASAPRADVTAATVPTVLHLDSGFDMHVRQYAAEGRTLLLWLPSKYGLREGHAQFAAQVQQQGIDLWLVDLHESYLAPTGGYAFDEFEPEQVAQLLAYAVDHGWRNIVLGGESRGAALALRAARQWQIAHPRQQTLKGLLLYHPYLIEEQPALGEAARFQAIARETNLPAYIFQPQLNTKYLYSEPLLARLQAGGSAVYFHVLQGVRGGYYLRDEDLLLDAEVVERRRLGTRIRNAIERLIAMPTPAFAAADSREPTYAGDGHRVNDGSLAPLPSKPAPALRLSDQHGQMFDLDDNHDEVVLVNFWASWCGPCVREIASIERLVEHFRGRPFRVVAVNIGETREHVGEFFSLRDITPNFDVLYDDDSAAAKDWHVYAIPTSFLLDPRHRLRYGYRGALKWDNPSVIATIEELLPHTTAAGAAVDAQ